MQITRFVTRVRIFNESPSLRDLMAFPARQPRKGFSYSPLVGSKLTSQFEGD